MSNVIAKLIAKEQAAKAAKRANRRTNGQFSHGFEVVCVCGATKGSHTAEAPFTKDETNCDGFKKAGN